MPPRLLPTPKSSPYVQQFLAQKVDAFGKKAQNAQFAAKLGEALAQAYGAYKGGKREQAQSAELANLMAAAGASQDPRIAMGPVPATGELSGVSVEGAYAPRTGAQKLEYMMPAMMRSEFAGTRDLGQQLALAELTKQAPETWEVEEDPFGRGGVALKNQFGDLKHYQGPVETKPRDMKKFEFQKDGEWFQQYKEFNPDTNKWEVVPDTESPLYQPEKPTHKVFFDQTGEGRPPKDVLTSDPEYPTLMADQDWSTDEPDAPTQMLEYFNSVTNHRKLVRRGSSEESELLATDGWTLEKPADPEDTVEYWKADIPKIVRKGSVEEDALIEEGGWSTDRETKDENIVVFYDTTDKNRPPVDMLKNDPSFKTYLQDSEWTTKPAPNQPSVTEVLKIKRAGILATIPLPDYGPQDDGVGGTTIPTDPQQRAKISLEYWQRVYAAEKEAGTLSGPDGQERIDKLMERIEAAQQMLDPQPGYTGDTLGAQMGNDLNTIGQLIARNKPITFEQAQLYENARAERTAPRQIIDQKTGRVSIYIEKLNPMLFPPLDQATILDPPTTLDAPKEGEETGDWSSQLHSSLQDAGYEIRTVQAGEDLSVPIRNYLNEAATIMTNAERTGKKIYGIMGWGKKKVAGIVRQVVPFVPPDWGLEAQKLDKVLLEIQLALAPEKLQESRFSNFEREMIQQIVGELNAASDEATIRMSLVRLATAIEMADKRLQR